ncbi:MAG: IS110 family transposase [Caldilineaceae bacterium SB0665_bin_21]|nr:IS110 family transposase [Caldilineaceae bacterium SB0665_bin_21]
MHRFANSGPGLRRLLQNMACAGATQAVCETTGGYERLLVSRLRAVGISVQVAHPLRVRAFARACGD